MINDNFNPRTREGCDRGSCNGSKRIANFNPRTREGCDLEDKEDEEDSDYISIHAPAKGATLKMMVKK